MEDVKMALTESQREALLDARIPKNIRTLVEQNHAQLASQGKSLEAMLGSESFKDYVDLSEHEDGDKPAKSGKESKASGDKDAKFFEAQGQLMADILTSVNTQGKALRAFGLLLKDVAEEIGLEIVAASEADETEVPEGDEEDDDLDFDLEDDDEESEPEPRKARRKLESKRRGKDNEDTFLGLRLT
jgi:hypothetical protein